MSVPRSGLLPGGRSPIDVLKPLPINRFIPPRLQFIVSTDRPESTFNAGQRAPIWSPTRNYNLRTIAEGHPSGVSGRGERFKDAVLFIERRQFVPTAIIGTQLNLSLRQKVSCISHTVRCSAFSLKLNGAGSLPNSFFCEQVQHLASAITDNGKSTSPIVERRVSAICERRRSCCRRGAIRTLLT
jgi:hypothetical protein